MEARCQRYETATLCCFLAKAVAYYDDTEENLGKSGPRSESSVDIEAGGDGSFHVAYGIPGRQTLARREVSPALMVPYSTTQLCFMYRRKRG